MNDTNLSAELAACAGLARELAATMYQASDAGKFRIVPDDLCDRILAALTASEAQPAQPALREALQAHHEWHLASEPDADGAGGAEAYCDSALFDRTVAALAAPVTEPRQCCVEERERWPDHFIFNWFNERDPDEMRACLEAREKAATAIRGETP
jgi:hypothetical protein